MTGPPTATHALASALAMAHRRDRAPHAALRHPVFWVALVVLALNDHVRKGAGLLPGPVTGKLSDFAGLVVAPIVLAGLSSARTRWSVASCTAAVGVVFTAINVSEPAAAWVESGMAWMGWRVWTDPTDLVALPSLGLASWLLMRRTPSTSTDRRDRCPFPTDPDSSPTSA